MRLGRLLRRIASREERCVKPITGFDCAEWNTNFAAWIEPDMVDLEGYVPRKLRRRLDPFLSYAMVAGKKALEDAGVGIGFRSA